MKRRAFGSGGGGGRDIVDTGRVMEETFDGMPEALPLSQTRTYPSTRDYDSSDTLYLDRNKTLLLHEGDVQVEADYSKSLSDLTSTDRDYAMTDIGGYDAEYTDENTVEDADVRLGQRQPWVAIDLDGTILDHPPHGAPEYGSKTQQLPLGEPFADARDALAELKSLGWRISIYTARFGDEALDEATIARWADEIAAYLKENEIPFSDIWVGRKPRADFFVDDKAIRFEGDWLDVLQQLAVESSGRRSDDDLQASGGPLDYDEGPNDFNDPLGDRGQYGTPRPPELEGVLAR